MNKEYIRKLRKACKYIIYILPRFLCLLNSRDVLKSNAVDLAIVAIIKNEGLYIEEWIKYHILVGVQKFYLYDNGSSDNTKEILKKYVDLGYVELIDYPGRARQLPAYNDALKRFRKECKYMAFIDGDEFLYSCEQTKSVREQVNDIFLRYPYAGGIAVNWRMFGSSGYVNRPEGGVLANYLYRAKEDGRGNACIKTIVNPRKVFRYDHVHYPTYICGYFSVSENGKKVKGWCNPVMEIKHLRINHYFTKSKEEWIERRSIGFADNKDQSKKRSLEEFELHDNNDIRDEGMLFYVNKL